MTATLPYADRQTLAPPRRRSKLALAAALWCLASALASFLLLYATDAGALSQHFLCCNHPEVAMFAFVVVPAIGAVAGVGSLVRLARARGALKGWVPAVAAVVLGPGLTLVGWGLVHLVKM